MAARSRPRGGQHKDEFDEERSLWNQIRADARRIDQLMAESDKLQKKITDLEEQQSARLNRGDEPSSRIDSELETLLRENIKITNELQGYLKPVEGGSDICSNITLLSALRNAEDSQPSASRAPSVGHGKSGRDRHGKRKLTDSIDDRDSMVIDSPASASPKVVISSQKDRLAAKAGSSRAGSVPAAREASAKLEDDKDDSDISKTRLAPSTEVLYRDPKKRTNTEGEGILCRVTSVIGEGKQRRYEIIDADPDPPTPSIPYRASVNHLVPIPSPTANTTLPDLNKGKNVLALYPGTTTFYKAEVVAGWRVSDGKVKKEEEGGQDNLVRLRFEGEDEADREMSVERRYVLPDR
ncbi:SGF29 tudor-like domain-containing protein [Phaeosphaeria sp. MPI-PUGE-AT-0046c]|nr:SGF29 tudor-like domain-containing protein [Phaeosphaeria sp. MPI-PUGE-AT-0046c]